MEKQIFIYSALILILLVTILGLLLWEEESEPCQIAGLKKTLLLTCVSIIAGLILHLNWLILPWAKDQAGELVALLNFGFLAVTFALVIWCLYKSFIASETNHSI